MSVTVWLAPTYRQMLAALATWLRKAQAQDADPDALMSERLAPDMFPLSTQVRFACRQAHEGLHRLRRQAFPAIVDELLTEGRQGGEQPGTISDAILRIEETIAFLDTLTPDALDDGAAQPLSLELPAGLAFDMNGVEYARDWALPQFYFHVVTAYAILRSRGIGLGKADYVGHMFAYRRTE
jgi:hypothetical protein